MYKDLDNAILKIYNQLFINQYVSKEITNMTNYYLFERNLKSHYYIPDTSITQVMSRLLYLLGQNFNNKYILGAGIYTGNAITWLSYDVLENNNGFVCGVDLSEEAIKIAKTNFSMFNKNNYILKAEDIFTTVKKTKDKSVDIFYLDIDSKETGKSEYTEIVKLIYPKMKLGGLILAHDINEKIFEKDMKNFGNYVLDSDCYKGINIDVDECGLLVIKKEV